MFKFLFAAALVVTPVMASAQQVTSTFGTRSDPFHGKKRMHAGVDMGAKTGTPVYATGDGIIRRSRVAGGYGNLVEIDHGFGYQTRYGHLSRLLVAEGSFVRRGQMVGLVGSTGRSTGPHLHYEVRIGGKPVDPTKYMQIVFTRQPDWNAIRYAILSGDTVKARPVARVAAARAVSREDRGSVSGDLEIDYGTGKAPAGVRATAKTPGLLDGHTSYSGVNP